MWQVHSYAGLMPEHDGIQICENDIDAAVVNQIGIMLRTMFAELQQRAFDDDWAEDFPPLGQFSLAINTGHFSPNDLNILKHLGPKSNLSLT